MRPLLLAALAFAAAPAALGQPFGEPLYVSSDFLLPTGVAVHGDRVVVCDTAHQQLAFARISTLTASPAFTAFGHVTGVPSGATLGRPVAAVAVGASLFVVDQAGGEVQRYDFDGTTYAHQPAFLTTPGVSAGGTRFFMPTDLAADGAGNLYLLDGANHRIVRAEAPGYAAWTVWREDATWPLCTGLDVDPAGATAWLACNGDRPLLEVGELLPDGSTARTLGLPGTGDGLLSNPQDVALGALGQLVVADTGNARIELYDPATSIQTHVVAGAGVSAPSRLALSAGRLFATDTARGTLIAFLDSTASLADVYVRDSAWDDGAEPSLASLPLSSPDLIVRHAPDDVNLEDAELLGLSAYASEEPLTHANNYVYVGVFNRGSVDALSVLVDLSTADAASPLASPADFSTDDFYRSWDTELLNEPNHTLVIDRIPAASSSGGSTLPGYRVIGPLVWRPRARVDAARWDGATQLVARVHLSGDATVEGTGLDVFRNSNNVARRPLTVRRSPPAVGAQNTLVVLARFAGSSYDFDRATVDERLNELDLWLDEVSRGATRIEANVAGPYELMFDRAHYEAGGQDPLVELTQEVVARAHLEYPQYLDGLAAGDPADDVRRVVVLVNDPGFAADRATTGAWPYTVAGADRWLSTSVHTLDSPLGEWAHAFSHQLGMEDLFLYSPLTFDPAVRVPRTWDVMARSTEGAAAALHPLVSSKLQVPWLLAGAGLRFIPRPLASADTGVVPLSFQSALQAGQVGGIVLGFTPGVTHLEDEKRFLVVEARSPTLGNADSALRGPEGVVVYRYDADIPQGQAPVLLQDHAASTATDDDAAVPVGGTHSVRGAQVSVLARTGGDPYAGYDVRVQFTPPAIVDLGFEPQEAEWESPDVWVDSPVDGQVMDAALAVPGEEQPQGGAMNFIYARVHNYGDAPAHDVEAFFELSSPYHTVGGVAQFDPLGAVMIPLIPAHGTANVRIAWSPPVGDPHNCVQVTLRRTVADESRGNDRAQQNMQVQSTTPMGAMTTSAPSTGTPSDAYLPATLDVQYRNTSVVPTRVYLRAENLPAGWSASYPRSAVVAPGARLVSRLTVKAPKTAPLCTKQPVRLTSWTPNRDTLERQGGATLVVALQNPVKLGAQAWTSYCEPKLYGTAPCSVIRVQASSTYAKAQKVVARFTEASGYSHFKTLTTDAAGRLNTSFVARNGGTWQVKLTAPGDSCMAPASFATQLAVPLQLSTDQDKDGLPDAKELSGDFDGDGRANVYDPDSDNDGLKDGYEKPGDSDQDGTPDVIDAKWGP